VIKIFYNLTEVYPYYTECPICNGKLINSIVNKHPEYKSAYSRELFYTHYIPTQITIKSGGTDEIIFDINSGKIISMSISQSASYHPIYPIGSPGPVQVIRSPIKTDYDIRDGILVQGHRIDCKQCMQYAYTLQLRFDLTDLVVESAILNSEFVSIEDGENVHEIRNVYTMNKTEYSHINRKKRHNTLQLPLVSDDLSNPQEVLNRIKKLIIFS